MSQQKTSSQPDSNTDPDKVLEWMKTHPESVKSVDGDDPLWLEKLTKGDVNPEDLVKLS